MKIKQIVLLLFSCLTLALNAQETKIQNLKSSFLQNDWDTFFEAFPETFEERKTGFSTFQIFLKGIMIRFPIPLTLIRAGIRQPMTFLMMLIVQSII